MQGGVVAWPDCRTAGLAGLPDRPRGLACRLAVRAAGPEKSAGGQEKVVDGQRRSSTARRRVVERMEHEAEPGPAEAVGQDTAGTDPGAGTGPGAGGETAPAEAGGAIGLGAGGETATAEAGGATGSADVPVEEATGEARVDAALKLLDRLPGLPVSDHPELFEQVHARLSEVLGELETGSGTAGPAGR